jgi:acyl carrier protein
VNASSVEEIVIASIAKVVEIDPETVHPWDTLDALSLDSLELLLVSVELEDELGSSVSLGGDDVAVLTTVQSLIDLVINRLQGHRE